MATHESLAPLPQPPHARGEAVSSRRRPAPGGAIRETAVAGHMSGVFRSVLLRDLRLASRRRIDALQPLAFFVVALSMFPLGVGPEPQMLREIAPGIVWVCALLASMLSVNTLFAGDLADGSLEQMLLAPEAPIALVAAKCCAHWLLSGLPLALMSPIAAYALAVPPAALPGIVAAVSIGTIALSLLGAVSAALTIGIRRGGALLSLLTLPLAVPLLIFGAQATARAIEGGNMAAPMYFLGAFAVLGVTLAPLAAAAAVRISLE